VTRICTPERSVTPDLDEQFLDLVCSDEDLLRAEFDAIIAAGWPSTATARPPDRPPGPRPPAPDPPGRGPGANPTPVASGGPRASRRPVRQAPGWDRPRSPPPRSGGARRL
jgi:hypothetical protein